MMVPLNKYVRTYKLGEVYPIAHRHDGQKLPGFTIKQVRAPEIYDLTLIDLPCRRVKHTVTRRVGGGHAPCATQELLQLEVVGYQVCIAANCRHRCARARKEPRTMRAVLRHYQGYPSSCTNVEFRSVSYEMVLARIIEKT